MAPGRRHRASQRGRRFRARNGWLRVGKESPPAALFGNAHGFMASGRSSLFTTIVSGETERWAEAKPPCCKSALIGTECTLRRAVLSEQRLLRYTGMRTASEASSLSMQSAVMPQNAAPSVTLKFSGTGQVFSPPLLPWRASAVRLLNCFKLNMAKAWLKLATGAALAA